MSKLTLQAVDPDTPTTSAPDPFDLASLRLNPSFIETAGVKKLLTTVCPLYPRKRTLGVRREMSALCQKQTLARSARRARGSGGYSCLGWILVQCAGAAGLSRASRAVMAASIVG